MYITCLYGTNSHLYTIKNALVNDVNGCICSQTLKEKWLSIMWEERWLEPVFLTMKAVDECYYVAFFKASLATFAHFCIQRVKFLLSPIHFNTWHEVPERAWHVTWMQQSNSVWRRSTMTPSTWNSGTSILVCNLKHPRPAKWCPSDVCWFLDASNCRILQIYRIYHIVWLVAQFCPM